MYVPEYIQRVMDTEICKQCKNIVIGKFGRSILFNENKWAAVGGDNEPAILFKTLAKYNPNINFYFLGKTDYKTGISNLINIWNNYKKKTEDDHINWPLEALKDIKIDAGIFMAGPMGQANIPNKIKKIHNNDDIAKVLCMFTNYVGPQIHYLNETRC
jgi:hypothetical protein